VATQTFHRERPICLKTLGPPAARL
jgi:hypothetical protein